MALSPNYGWSEPDNSSLVKNGAADIRTLGDAIDTSVWNVGFGQAGKNKIINGDFRINQRAFTSTTTNSTYGFDRWQLIAAGDGSCTYSAQTFTPGSAPVAGYEANNFARLLTASQTTSASRGTLQQAIEDVRTFAGQTITISFWAKAATGTPKIALELGQSFGTGGSTSVNTYAGQVTISTSWARYSITVAIPSVSGKTIVNLDSSLITRLWVSAGSDFNSRTGSLGIQNNTFDIWGVQAEYGSKATPFQTASGNNLQAELAMCQRYYYRVTPGASGRRFGTGMGIGTTGASLFVPFPVSMRTEPTALEQSGTAGDYSVAQGATVITCSAVPTFGTATTINGIVTLTVASGTVDTAASMARAAATAAYLGWSAEL
jgi:hypothetical protein